MAETESKTPVQTEAKTPTVREEAQSPFEALRREIDRLFEDFGPVGWRMPFRRPSAFELAWPRLEGWQHTPAMDMVEKDDAFEISAELPGLDEKNVEIKLSGGNLTIKGEKKQETEERKKEYYLSERRYGSFQRTFRVPEGVDPDKIDASFKNGVLTVTLPKSPAAAPSEKQIAINAR
jgi:HSP20 family protein